MCWSGWRGTAPLHVFVLLLVSTGLGSEMQQLDTHDDAGSCASIGRQLHAAGQSVDNVLLFERACAERFRQPPLDSPRQPGRAAKALIDLGLVVFEYGQHHEYGMGRSDRAGARFFYAAAVETIRRAERTGIRPHDRLQANACLGDALRALGDSRGEPRLYLLARELRQAATSCPSLLM